MRFLSVCSGIECATQAWAPLGWQCVAASEIEKFPSALLAHHYPDVPNLGDMTQHHTWPDELSPDLLVGGTPCQSFSVAGLRGGLDDARGNLMLSFADIARRYRPRWLVWENVPGVLSSDRGQDFASLLGVLTGQRLTIPKEGWQNSGIVPGIPAAYGLAWRVLDAQHFGVPQRRRRVFVVGYLGDYRRAAAVLLERHSLQGHPAPSRKKGQGTAPTISSRPSGGGGLGTDFDLDGGLIAPTLLNNGRAAGSATQQDAENGLLVAATVSAQPPSRRNGGSEPTPGHLIVQDVADSLTANWHNSNGAKAGNNAGMVNPVLTLAIRGRGDSHDLQTRDDGTANAILTPNGGRAGIGVGAVAYTENQRNEVREMPIAGALSSIRRGDAKNETFLQQHMAVRRLTPRECERLQGYADDYTLVPFRGKPAADGPRYKAIGNGMAVPVMRWLGERIAMVEQLASQTTGN